ncbi:hypothetical protein FOPG_18558 [Fusarium oxysporum f. sp. conglutinans race 2 54008]|uniref:Uncharacterized protein n=1 Tax=Fusarium oxysporum f. sp. conglutinans race 2 54008 TaxID=1089457 RepID=X0GZF1_FUSOX|nr:hypothetical protein FOPG_18558 [Fusarium oxysporum f. sp. conglutinans race 2 54008]
MEQASAHIGTGRIVHPPVSPTRFLPRGLQTVSVISP